MSCPDCTNAAQRVWGGFTHACLGCTARSVSRLPAFKRVGMKGRLDHQYLELCRQHNVTHEQVKAARLADAEAKIRA